MSEQLVFPEIGHPPDRVVRRYLELRDEFPELRRALTWNGLKSMLHRLGIPIVYAPLPRRAALVSSGGCSVLIINSNVPPRRHTYYAAHELAHQFLHVADDEAPVYHMDEDIDADDVREDDAEFLAALMLHGVRFVRY